MRNAQTTISLSKHIHTVN